VSSFGDVLDLISIMNYDVGSNSSFGAGSSSPLDDSCAPIHARSGSAKSAVAAWTSAGIPVQKLLLGVPSYSHSFVTLSSHPGGTGQTKAPEYPLYSSIKHQGDRWDVASTDVCGKQWGFGGTFEYWGLIEGGFLYSDGSPREGIQYRFDNCSKTVGSVSAPTVRANLRLTISISAICS
jgi:chitinase